MNSMLHEVWINAERSTVFDAITTRDGLDAWWGKAVQAEPQPGSVVEFDHGFGAPLQMRITDLVAGERVAWRCESEFTDSRNPASEWFGHELTFDLGTPEGDPALEWLGPRLGYSESGADATIVHFSHSGWRDDSRWYAFCNLGWGATLAGLEQYCETGEQQ